MPTKPSCAGRRVSGMPINTKPLLGIRFMRVYAKLHKFSYIHGNICEVDTRSMDCALET